MTGTGQSNAKSIELIEIATETSFRSKQEQKQKLIQEEAALRKTVAENPNSRRAKLELAKFLFHQNQFQNAQELAVNVLELDEGNANAFCLLGRIHGFGKPEDVVQSEAYFKHALESDAEYAKAHYFYAYLLRSRLHRYTEAEKHYKCAMELRPEDVTSYNDCAIMLVRQNRCIEAKKLYEKVLALQPDHSIAHFNLANLLRKDLKNYLAAEKHFLISIQKRPKFTAALNNYATMLHHQLRRYAEAEHYYRQALSIDPKYSRAHFNYANLCREHLKKYALAQEHYLEAIKNDALNPNFYNNYGLLLQYALKQYIKAKTQYEVALKLDDGHALGHCNYATILMQMVDRKYNRYYDERQDCFLDNHEQNNNNHEDLDRDPYFDDDDDDESGLIEHEDIPFGTYEEFVLNHKFNNDAFLSKNLRTAAQKNKATAKSKLISNANANTNSNETANENDEFLVVEDDSEENEDNNRLHSEHERLNEERLEVYSCHTYSGKRDEYFSKSEFHFKKSILLNASLVMAYNNYGCLLRRLKQFTAAKQMFEKALSIDPKFVMAKRNLDRAIQREMDIANGVDPDAREQRQRNAQRSGNKHYAARTKASSNDEQSASATASVNKIDEKQDEQQCLLM